MDNPQGLSLPTLERSSRPQMPWEAKTLYSVETPEGDLLTLTPEQLKIYTARQKAAKNNRE